MSATTKKPTKPTAAEANEALTALAELPKGQAPAMFANDIDQFAGAGTSDRKEDNVIPFLLVLQKGSPQVNDKKSEYVPGAKPGMLFNSATRRLYDAQADGAGPTALQGFMAVHEVEWIPRSQGGGFVAQHPIDTPLLEQITEVSSPENPNSNRKLRMLPNGHQLVTTAYHYLILPETLEPVVVSLTSTGLRTHRNWNTMYRNKKIRNSRGEMVIAPSFATLVRLRTFWQENESGDWYTLAVDDLGWVSDADAYNETKKFHISAIQDGVRTAEPKVESSEENASPVVEGRLVADEEIPF